MMPQAAVNTKTARLARTRRVIMAANNSNLPDKIEIMRAGTWPDGSSKGKLVITQDDLVEFKNNFDKGLAQAGQGLGLPIDFGHEEWSVAAGWMKELIVDGDKLLAKVEWTRAGKEALEGGEYKCFSPSFYPACLGEWSDYENPEITATNVLVGGALTNIPFFKDLTPVVASRSLDKTGGNDEKNIIYVSASENKELSMTLDEIRGKEADQLTEDEKTFLTEHKAELSADEKTKFGFEVEGQTNPGESTGNINNNKNEDNEVTVEKTEPVAASAVKGTEGKVVMAAKEVKAMHDTITELNKVAADYRNDKAKAFVEAHAKRGAIKADQIDKWTEKIIADESNKELLAALPDNQVVASEQGSSTKASAATASEEIMNRATEAVKASQGKISLADAMKQVVAEDKELSDRYISELAENN